MHVALHLDSIYNDLGVDKNLGTCPTFQIVTSCRINKPKRIKKWSFRYMPDNSNRHLVAELTSPNGLKNGVFGEDNSLDVIIYENSNITLGQ